jgi:hypothetical protein
MAKLCRVLLRRQRDFQCFVLLRKYASLFRGYTLRVHTAPGMRSTRDNFLYASDFVESP